MGLLSKAAGRNNASDPVYQKDLVQAPPEYEALEGLPGVLKNEIIKYCNTYTSVHGIVLAYPKKFDEKKEKEPFNEELNRIVAALGSAVSLSPRYSLVLFSNTIDRELLAHRLSKSLETDAPVIFIADDVETVVNYIRPYL
ncbi:MAG: hypothetical protein LBT39_07020 [Treponema sp.]|jgi:hypothetical protein|nr:hypothetical protein [Treponema sp.]